MKSFFILVFFGLLSLQAAAQTQCAAYCLDLRSQKNPHTQKIEKQFNRSPLIKAANYQGLVAKCQSNFGTALVLGFNFKKSYNSSSKLTAYKPAKPQNACRSI